MAWVGHFRAAAMTVSSGDAGGIDDERHAVVVQVEDARSLVHAVSRSHAHVAVDLDVEAHGPIVRFRLIGSRYT